MKFYKVISKDNKAMHGGNFDYTDYLPKSDKAGKWLPIIDNIKECEKGYHVTNYWNMWLESKDNKIFEVEVKELLDKKESVGVIEKYVCGSFRFLKEIKVTFDEKQNTGHGNTGYWNTGDRNTGDRNTGHRNTGHWNTGDRNTGHWNTGDRNTGHSNTGHRNTGHRNTGHWNTGDSNTGDSNTGDSNTGDRNTGHWNTSNYNTGFFNTEEVKVIKVFNKECDKKVWDNCKKPFFIYFDLSKDYKKSFKESFNKATREDVELLINLPNFDYKVFEEISGITKLMINKKLK